MALFLKKIEISFAYKTFEWSNNAKNNAGGCIIVGLSIPNNKKLLIDGNKVIKTDYISPYLTSNNYIEVKSRQYPFSKLFPEMVNGNMSLEGGYLKLDQKEYTSLLNFIQSPLNLSDH